jgi:3-dehydroquinate synthetase
LNAVGLPTRIRDIPGLETSPGGILAAMRQDKKVERGKLTFILAKCVGKSFIARAIDEANVSAFLTRELAG